MNTITINITPKQQKALIIIALIAYGVFLYASGMEHGYTDGFSDAVKICTEVEGAC